ncbi:MAG: ATP-binding protein [Candidatus Cryosericum sp.]
MILLPSVLTATNKRGVFVFVAFLTLASIAIAVVSLESGFFIIFQNLFYFPIILACAYYGKKGFFFSVCLACGYFLLMLAFSRNQATLVEAAIRVLIFVLVAGLATNLTLSGMRAGEALKQAHDELEKRVAERTKELLHVNENLQVEIVERKRIEENLGKSESDLCRAQAVAHVGSWRWSNTPDKLSWSDEMYRIFGTARSAFTVSWWEIAERFIHPDDRVRVEEATRTALENHEPESIEYRIVRPDGTVRTVWDVTGDMILDDDGEVSSLTGIVVDITDYKQMEEKLHQSEKMKAIGALAGGVAHDFNNLLTGILGSLDLMRGNLAPGDRSIENLDVAEAAARQATVLTKGLLAFGRSSAVLPVSMRITTALDATVALLKQSLPAGIRIIRDHDPAPWNVFMDQSQLTQIVFNLATNARDAMQGTGTLTIRTRNEVVGEGYVQEHSFARTGEFVHLSVTDTGPGIPPEILEHVFEAFHTTKPMGSGTGLGLSVIYHAVKQSLGWITTTTGPSIGTSFDIFLPRCLEEPAELHTEKHVVKTADGETVLVVEDEAVVAAVTGAFLRRSGYAVMMAGDGTLALEILQNRSQNIGLVLLDMTMPGMVTRDVVQGIRDLDAKLPILLTSGFTANDEVRQMIDEGKVQGFIGKPYDLSSLMEGVQRLVRQD